MKIRARSTWAGGIWCFGTALLLAWPLAAQYTLGTAAGGSVPSGVAATGVLLRPLEAAVDQQGGVYTTDGAVVYRITPAGTLTAVAGNGRLGYSGDNGPATSAQLNSANGVSVDAAGNIYIADTNNHVVRKVTPGGVISTIAGNGTAGYSGDNGPATSAQLRFPQAVTVDPAGASLYIADTLNNVVRRVSNGTITTFAGTGAGNYNGDNIAAPLASLFQPAGLALDTANALYIADRLNHRIRKVAGGQISTVAGTGLAGFSGDGGNATTARLNVPQGVTVDTGNNIYIADTGNFAVRKVGSTGLISTVAGSNTPGFAGDGGPATSAQLRGPQRVAADTTGNLYIADTPNNRVRKVTSGTISTFAGGGTGGDGGAPLSAQFLNPSAVAVSRSGDIYVADLYDHRVRKVSRTGVITTVAGTGTAGYSGDGGAATSAKLFAPNGLALDAQNNLYVADTGNNVVRKVDASSGVITTVAGTGTAGYSGDGGAATSARLQNPWGVAVDSAGVLYIADTFNSVIRKVTAGGTISTMAGSGTAGYSGDNNLAVNAQLNIPTGIALSAGGILYIADYGNAAVRKVDASGVIATVAGSGPSSIGASGDNGPATSAQLSQPRAVAVDATGNLYVVDYGNNRVRKVAVASGVITTVAGGGSSTPALGDGGPATSVALAGLQGVAADNNLVVYVSDASTNRLRSLSLPAVQITLTSSPASYTVILDGTSYGSPTTLALTPGSQHTISVSVPSGASFVSWSDGGAQTHTITIPSVNTTYTATVSGSTGGCTYQVSPANATFSAAPSSSSVNVVTQAGCTYSAASNASFLTITNGPSYSGSAAVSFSFGANIGAIRTGTLTVAGQNVTVTQLASPSNAPPLVNKIGIFRTSGAGGVLWVRDRDGDGLFTVPPDTALGVGVLGTAGDQAVIGDWSGSGTKKLGIYRPFGSSSPGAGLFVLDYDGSESWNGAVDKALYFPAQAGDLAVVGRWAGGTQDQVGVYRNGVFYLDANSNGTFTKVVVLGQAGDLPVVGDWNGDGRSKVGIFRNGLWVLDYNGNGQWDGTSVDRAFYLGTGGDQPVVGDWNGDGRGKAGVFRKSGGLWVLDYNGNGAWDGTAIDRALYNGFDTSTSTAITGDWTGDGKVKAGVFNNGTWFLDIAGDGSFSRLAYLGQTADAPVVGKW